MTIRTPHKFSLAIYLLLANGITWLCWIPGLLIGAQRGYTMPNFDTYATLFETGFVNIQHLVLGAAFILGAFGPLVGSLVATWMDSGREGIVQLWKRMTTWRIGLRWYLTAILITFLVPAIPVVVFVLNGGALDSASVFTLPYFLFVLVAQLLTSGLGEEPGWRGYLLPRLQDRFDSKKQVWILGLIWAIWHYPLVILLTLSMMQDVTPPQMIITILMSLAGQTISLIGLSYIYVWLYNRTGSVFLSILFHALSNLFPTFLLSFLVAPQTVSLLIAAMPWLVVLILQKWLGKDEFPGRPLAD